jgi:hypothetical protein
VLNHELQRAVEIAAAELDAGFHATTSWLKVRIPWGVTPRSLRLIYLAQRGRCALCRELMLPWLPHSDPRRVSREHVLPRFWGGRGEGQIANLLLSHADCNAARGCTLPSDELKALAREIYARLARYQGEHPIILQARRKGWPGERRCG